MRIDPLEVFLVVFLAGGLVCGGSITAIRLLLTEPSKDGEVDSTGILVKFIAKGPVIYLCTVPFVVASPFVEPSLAKSAGAVVLCVWIAVMWRTRCWVDLKVLEERNLIVLGPTLEAERCLRNEFVLLVPGLVLFLGMGLLAGPPF